MFLGHPNLSSWLTAKLLATYSRKRFNIQNPAQRQAYISAHQYPEANGWKRPIDLKRVSFTNLSLYNTEYSIFKYLLETELDVLQKAPYNQLTVYTEIIEDTALETFINPIDADTFLVGIHAGRLQHISNLFLSTEVVTNILEPLSNLSKINTRFLESFAMELAVKATIYKEFAKIFTQHPVIKNSLPGNIRAIREKYKNDCLVGDFLVSEIQTRTQAMIESAFFEKTHDKDSLTTEMLYLCIASLYVYYVEHSKDTDEISAEEQIFAAFNNLTEQSLAHKELMLEAMESTHPIMELQGIKNPTANLHEQHDIFGKEIKTGSI